jgi:tetratricopeptide (TPR) repeat protein
VPAPAPAPDEASQGHASSPEAATPKPQTYEHLVAQADHYLENGQTGKAQRLYDEALKLQPDGVAAITGSAYLLLDRQKPLAAIGLFKKALASAPTFPTALFGLGEAYRAHGDNGQALDAYKRYLETDPGGPDAPAARRQVRELSAGAGSAPPASPPQSATMDQPPSPARSDQPPPAP